MTENNSTRKPRQRKPSKPKKPKDSPLFPHNNGQWAKKVRGKIHFFGVWADHQKALEKWLDEKDDLLAGRVPRSRAGVADTPTLALLVNTFLTTKKKLLDAGEMSRWTWKEYDNICGELVREFGRDRLLSDITPDDFSNLREKWAKKWGAERLNSEINRARVVFNFAFKHNRMIPAPMLFGEGFNRPSKKVRRLNRHERGVKMFEADELRRILDGAIQPMRSMVLLAINCGLGNNDVGQLKKSNLDLEPGWLVYPRPKTGILRRCPLWPETVAALEAWFPVRPAPASEADEHLVFITRKKRRGWTADLKDRPITREFGELLRKVKIEARGRNFYALRHTFETIGGETRDQVAVDAIMGHSDDSMAAAYRERIGDDRLQAVTDHLHKWLFPGQAGTAEPVSKTP